MGSTTGAGYEQRIGAARGAFATIARAWTDDDLLTVAKQVTEVLAHPGWVRMAEVVAARADLTAVQVTHGKVLERHEYAALTGVIAGYEQAVLVGDVIRLVAAEREAEIRDKSEREG